MQSDVISSRWEIESPFDDQLQDPLNFGLSDALVALILSVLTGFMMAMVLNICFRALIRARGTIISTHMIHKRYLLTTVLNPMKLLGELKRTFSSERENESKRERNTFRSTIQLLFVITVAVLIAAAEILLIFLSSTRTQPVYVDRRQMPSFELHYNGSKILNTNRINQCEQFRLTRKPGFSSEAFLQVCKQMLFLTAEIEMAQGGSSGYIFVHVRKTNFNLVAAVNFNGTLIGVTATAKVLVGRGVEFTVLNSESAFHASAVLNATFKLWKYPIVKSAVDHSQGSDDWTVGKAIPLVELPPLSENDLIVHMLSIVTGTFVLKGLGRAMSGTGSTPGSFLDEIDVGPLIVKRRPWISLGVALIMSSLIIIIWVVIAFGLHWSNGVDERWGWISTFQTTSSVDDFRFNRDEEVLDVDRK